MFLGTLLFLFCLAGWGLAEENNNTYPFVEPHIPSDQMDDMSDVEYIDDITVNSSPFPLPPWQQSPLSEFMDGQSPVFKIIPGAVEVVGLEMPEVAKGVLEGISQPWSVGHAIPNLIKPFLIEALLDWDKSDEHPQNTNKVRTRLMNKMIAQLVQAFPTYNCLISHTQPHLKPVRHLLDVTTTHQEYDVGVAVGMGYDLMVFTLGYFKRAGDGGIINWAFAGNYTRDKDSPEVLFEPVRNVVSYVTPEVWERPIIYIPHNQTTTTQTTTTQPEATAKPDANANPIIYVDPSEIERLNPEHRKRAASLPAWNAGIHRRGEFQSAPKPDVDDPASLRPVPEWDSSPERTHRPAAAKAKRDVAPNDGTHFVYCKNATDGATANAGIAYYRDLVPGADGVGRLPDDFVWVTEGHGHFFRMSVGAAEFGRAAAAVEWSIWGHAMDDSTPVGSVVGTANDGLDHFWMYKDDGKALFETDGYKCFSEYYAF